jgi:hypothetical protein
MTARRGRPAIRSRVERRAVQRRTLKRAVRYRCSRDARVLDRHSALCMEELQIEEVELEMVVFMAPGSFNLSSQRTRELLIALVQEEAIQRARHPVTPMSGRSDDRLRQGAGMSPEPGASGVGMAAEHRLVICPRSIRQPSPGRCRKRPRELPGSGVSRQGHPERSESGACRDSRRGTALRSNPVPARYRRGCPLDSGSLRCAPSSRVRAVPRDCAEHGQR